LDGSVTVLEQPDNTKLLVGTVRQALDQAYNGNLLVIKTSEHLKPFSAEFTFSVQERQQHNVNIKDHVLTQHLAYDAIEWAYPIASEGIVLMENDYEQAVVSLIPYGSGAILYYGLDDSVSDFKTTYAF